MTEWWASLSAAQHIFYVIAIPSTAFLVLQLLLNLVGLAGHDVDIAPSVPEGAVFDHPDIEAHSTGMAILSVRTVTAFFVGLGWSGVFMLASGASLPLTIAVALPVGMLFLYVVFYLMKALYRLSESGNIDFKNAIGGTGTVYIPIPAKGKGSGQIQIVVQGRLREIPAVTDCAEALPTGTSVQVVEAMSGATMLVRKVEVK